MDSYNRGAAGPQNRGARSPPLLPRAGRGNQSWLTGPLSGWITDQKGHCHRRGTRYRYQVVSDWYQDGIRWYVVSLYTRHIRKY